MKKFLLIIVALTAMIFASCSKEKDANDVEKEQIEKLLARYGDTCFVEHNGIYLYLTEEGDKEYASSDIVKMIYTGQALQGNNTFAKNDTMNFVYGKSGLISGFIRALPYIKRNSKGQLLIPYQYGYGARRVGTIEPYSTLLFTFEME
ncbi:MAG: FKBP-type peptidyl-prolyl cis-trans isomerase [Bacteroidales bacterium]|nr:FKBP-type peptidyl-prolyl cis-trans isomerase [Bacteroidales bacterium]MBR2199282.1 FKBP-type peptidyl-prolyl cis-trans isomerase [Bacteroidales bacterium]